MPTIVHEFDWPDRVVIGTIGRPGERTFYLQARTGNRIVSTSLEKEQSALLAEKIDEILDELMVNEGNAFSVPSSTPVELIDEAPLDQPVDEQFRTGAIGLGWDPTTAQVVIEAYPVLDPEDDADPENPFAETESPSEMLLVRIPVGTARAFAKRAREIVASGRPVCPLCGMPIDAGGHVCAALDGS
ncbi:DUF3090 domain-containing protein [Humibacter sp. BT305]|uniref:Uncharacterized protein n=1 Tax=Cnuibacter physcomitrellae TaxID=1619308 RepID=A0A1X9LKA8_9MICO|nr:DUF3090 domain-containing protein [Cnuibacter physcomitrellae]ARJ04361.1 hypothetical protein B5808_03305 [Cnuibacter physcomitrellae]AXH36995.1 DUF3090 domain-containing protein [Humibacter sp. BT305]MCS5498402.1 DUF3090 domain-containing protein [Cnuibacter physcomitrellae]GGI40866.1 hypothetical protein GCM10010988_31230 [Cnuibacter physcomitrellae]